MRTDSEGKCLEISTRLIRPFADQPRKHFDQDKLNDLAKSIKAIGQQTPALVKVIKDSGFKFELIDGERRLRACQMLGLPLLAYVKPIKSNDDQLISSVAANFGRCDHTPMETARAIGRIKDSILKGSNDSWGEKVAERVAAVCAHSVGWVHQMLGLLRLHPEVQEMVDKRQIGFQVGVALTNLKSEAQICLAKFVVQKGFSHQRALSYIRANRGEHLDSSGRRRKPSDDYRILRRFLDRLGRDFESIMDMPQKSLKAMIQSRSGYEQKLVSRLLAKRTEELTVLRTTFEALASQQADSSLAKGRP